MIAVARFFEPFLHTIPWILPDRFDFAFESRERRASSFDIVRVEGTKERKLPVGVVIAVITLLNLVICRSVVKRQRAKADKIRAYAQGLATDGKLGELKELAARSRHSGIRRQEWDFLTEICKLNVAGRQGVDALKASLAAILPKLAPRRETYAEIVIYADVASRYDMETSVEFVRRASETMQKTGGNLGRALAAALTRLVRLHDFDGSDFEMEGRFNDDTEFNMNVYRGKVILVFGWTCQDETCVFMIPQIKELYEKFHSQGLTVLGYNCQDRPEAVRRYEKRYQTPWKNVSRRLTIRGRNALDERYVDFCERNGISRVPFVFLVDRDGKVHVPEDRANMEKLVVELLEKGRVGVD
ncbi:MAG: redoxin domain-containing protein [Thermoguttaceae bacterium]|nr:redoxin domain-containing protein [Thermoguttaceae bacterium]